MVPRLPLWFFVLKHFSLCVLNSLSDRQPFRKQTKKKLLNVSLVWAVFKIEVIKREKQQHRETVTIWQKLTPRGAWSWRREWEEYKHKSDNTVEHTYFPRRWKICGKTLISSLNIVHSGKMHHGQSEYFRWTLKRWVTPTNKQVIGIQIPYV